jgi:hypothetical protein
VAKVVANPEVQREFATTFTDDDFQARGQTRNRLRGWRIEANSNGQYRYRWQIKDATGQPELYVTSSGGTGYRRGSRYIMKAVALKELAANGKKRKKRR